MTYEGAYVADPRVIYDPTANEFVLPDDESGTWTVYEHGEVWYARNPEGLLCVDVSGHLDPDEVIGLVIGPADTRGLLVAVTVASLEPGMWLWDDEHQTVWEINALYRIGEQVEIELTGGDRVLQGPELLLRDPGDQVTVAAKPHAWCRTGGD